MMVSPQNNKNQPDYLKCVCFVSSKEKESSKDLNVIFLKLISI